MKPPSVSDPLELFNQATMIRDLPDDTKPIPLNDPASQRPPSSLHVPRQEPEPQRKDSDPQKKKRLLPPSLLPSSSSAPAAAESPPKKDTPKEKSSDHSQDEMIEKMRKMELELNHLYQMNQVLSDQMQKGLTLLGTGVRFIALFALFVLFALAFAFSFLY